MEIGGTSFSVANDSVLFALGTQQVIHNKETTFRQNSSNGLYLNAKDLFTRASALLPDSLNGAFNFRSAASSNPLSVTATAANNASQININVKVYQTAGSQPIRSDALTSNKSMNLSRSYYDFSIDTGTNTYKFRVETSQSDTYREVMQKAANAINNANVGLSANIVDNYSAPSSYLEIQGIPRSAMNSVTVLDVSGNLMSQLGVSATQHANGTMGGIENTVGYSKFALDGKTMFGPSNSIALYEGTMYRTNYQIDPTKSGQELYNDWVANGDQFMDMATQSSQAGGGIFGKYQGQFKLNGSSSSGANVSVRPDSGRIAQAVSDFFDSFNRTMDSLNNNSASGFKEAANFLSGVMADNQQQLSSLGIKNTGSGFQVDMNTLENRLKTNYQSVMNLFAGANGIASKTVFGVQKILYAPMFNLSNFTNSVGATKQFDATGFLIDHSI
jgi:flagellar capping protein FliD